ncbi:MAG: hypothetical protein ABJE47_10770 [bacterium]
MNNLELLSVEANISHWQNTKGYKSGAAIGALVLTCAGAAWAIAALANRSGSPPWAFAAVALPVLALITAGVSRLIAIARDSHRGPIDPEANDRARQGRNMGVHFGLVFTVEIVLIALTAILLARIGRPLLIPVAIVAIVGAHFLPLARLFRIPTYGVAGLLLVGASLGSLLIADEALRLFALGLLVAVVLWASAAMVLVRHTGWSSTSDAVAP